LKERIAIFMNLDRHHFIELVEKAFEVHPVVALLGPRQCGKTTLAKAYKKHFKEKTVFSYFDLEDPRHLARLESPMMALEELEGVIIIDEIQRFPDLFPILRVLVDQKKPRRFLILGSASRDLIQQSSETLSGRIRYLELTPFNLLETNNPKKQWLRGGFPQSFLASSNQKSLEWRMAYISTFLERDIPNLGIQIPPRTLRRFYMMLAHYHGGLFKASEIGNSLGFSHTTSRSYLDILSGTFMVRELSPWFENIRKRQVKTPKIYFRDTGILHALLGIEDEKQLTHHPKLGISWEGFALEEILRFHKTPIEESYFWAVHGQAELDLLLISHGKKRGFEFKFTDHPTLTKSMQLATELLNLDSLTVIVPGKENYPIATNIRVQGLENYLGVVSH
jgi:predicted AAA+ superfamily ATPase